MKNFILITALLSSVSFGSMAADKPKPTTKSELVMKPSSSLFVNAPAAKSAKTTEWECYEVTLSCDLHGIECGELNDVIKRVLQAEQENCGG